MKAWARDIRHELVCYIEPRWAVEHRCLSGITTISSTDNNWLAMLVSNIQFAVFVKAVLQVCFDAFLI